MKSSLLNILVLAAFTAVFSMTMVTVGSAGICGASPALSIEDDPNEPQPECAFETVIDGDPNDPEPQPETA
ncbi:MAG TPA: hypothetical protein VJJ98_12725 [Sedimentisphaerales bacterium]|nr:hypothetical protein [Sedimentisphaerales bacterium]